MATRVPEKSHAEKLADESERLLAELRSLPASAFMAGEILWLHHWTTKLRFATTAEREQRFLDDVKAAYDAIKARAERPSAKGE